MATCTIHSMVEIEVSDTAGDAMSTLDLFTKVAGLVALIYAYLFFAGWVYLISYFGRFELDLWALEVPIYEFPTFSVVALGGLIVSGGKLLFLALALFILVRALSSEVRAARRPTTARVAWIQEQLDRFEADVRRFYKSLAIPRSLTIGPAVVLVLGVTLVGADTQAAKAAQSTWNGGTHVRLVLRSERNQILDPALLRANDSNHLSLLTQTKDLVVVFEPKLQSDPKESIFVLARSDVASVHTWTEIHRKIRT